MKKILAIALSCLFAVSFAACGDTGNVVTPPGDNTTIDYKGTINVNLPTKDFSYEDNALKAVAEAYREKHPEVTINVQPWESSTYKDKLDSQFAGGDAVTDADIVQTLLISNTYATTKLVDFSDYLVKKNPYAENRVWKDTMSSDAYPLSTDRSGVYSLSFTSTMSLFFYNKEIWRQAGLTNADGTDRVPATWDELVEFCGIIADQTSKTPFTVGGATYTTNAMSWLTNIYTDQYYRSAVEQFHAVAGDYCYDPDIDAGWKLDVSDPDNDSVSAYTLNMLRFLSAINEGEIGPADAKYQAMMNNFKKLIPTYTQTNFTSNNYYQAEELFWSGDACLVYNTSDFFNTYKQLFASRPEANQFEIGFFLAPPMTGTGDAKPDADYVRSVGGAYGYYGVVKKDKAHTDLVMDFMMFWGSVEGQSIYNESLVAQGAYTSGGSLINGVDVPESIYPAKAIAFPGLCHNNPMGNHFGNLCAMNGTVGQSWNLYCKQFFDGNIDAAAFGDRLSKALKSGIPDYLSSLGWRTDALTDVSKNPLL